MIKLPVLLRLFPVFLIASLGVMVFRVGNFPISAWAKSIDPSVLTREHVSLYKDMEKHAQNLQTQQKALESKGILIKEQEFRIDAKLKELKKLSAWIHKVLSTIEESHESSLAKLIKALESMKAEDAGKILKGLPLDSLFFVAKKMKAAKLSSLLPHLDEAQSQALLQFSVRQVQSLKNSQNSLNFTK